jgi:hypothetical protein
MSRLRLTRRSRAAVAWGLAAFVAGQVGLFLVLRFWLPEWKEPYYGVAVRRVHQYLEHDPECRPVVMLGSSRVQDGFNPACLHEQLAPLADKPLTAFNFGIPGAGPIRELLVFKRLLADGIRPKLLLIEVFPFHLGAVGKAPMEIQTSPVDRVHLEELPILAHYGFPIKEAALERGGVWLLPAYQFRQDILSSVMGPWMLVGDRPNWRTRRDRWGWEGHPDVHDTPEQKERRVRDAYEVFGAQLQDFRFGPGRRALRDLLEHCREEEIPTALVLMPEHSELRSWYPVDIYQRLLLMLEDLRREYDAPVINAREWIPDEYFVDMQHLRVRGAEIFTLRLGQEFIQPWLAGKMRRGAALLTARTRE